MRDKLLLAHVAAASSAGSSWGYVLVSLLITLALGEVFRRWTGNLDLIVNMNNDVLDLLLPVESPLVLPYLTKFDNVVEKGLSTMNWKTNGICQSTRPSSAGVRVPDLGLGLTVFFRTGIPVSQIPVYHYVIFRTCMLILFIHLFIYFS